MPDSVLRPPGNRRITAAEAAAGTATMRDAQESSEQWVYSMSANIERAGIMILLGIEDANGDNNWLKQAHQPTAIIGSVSWSGQVPIPRASRIKATFKGRLVLGDNIFFSAVTEPKIT